MTDPEKEASEHAVVSQELVQQIMPILAGHEPFVQSATLADLLAMHLSGYFAGTPEETALLREQMLAEHLRLVRDLIQPNEDNILANVRERSS